MRSLDNPRAGEMLALQLEGSVEIAQNGQRSKRGEYPPASLVVRWRTVPVGSYVLLLRRATLDPQFHCLGTRYRLALCYEVAFQRVPS